MITLNVDLGDRSYPIYIGDNSLQNAGLLTKHIAGNNVLIVSNETIAPLYIERITQHLEHLALESVILPDGEAYKNLDVLNQIFDKLMSAKMDRDTTIVALGGGVVGDMAGFAAASYQRGINLIQVPTTLLSQVDSSVGGKTGVNHPLGKNMIGAFYQPKAVIADTTTLNSLDDRQLSAGLAEVIKYGLIRDTEFLSWIESNIEPLLERDSAALSYAISKSCKIKAEIVAADEREGGVRALLNLGHTFGHAIETGMGYGKILHGEAVACGMCMAARLSSIQGWLDKEDVERIESVIAGAKLPVRAPRELTIDRFLELMAVDKKVRDGVIRLVLLKNIGEAVVVADYREEDLHNAISASY